LKQLRDFSRGGLGYGVALSLNFTDIEYSLSIYNTALVINPRKGVDITRNATVSMNIGIY